MSNDSSGGAWGEEVLRIYPHRASISQAMWRNFFEEASREIGILTNEGRFLVDDSGLVRLLAEKAAAGVGVRILVGDPVGWEALSPAEGVRLVVHQVPVFNAIYRADDELIVHQYVHGVPGLTSPVMHLRKTGEGGLYGSYLEGFEQVWLEATCQR